MGRLAARPRGLFNGELGGDRPRGVEFSEGDEVRGEPLKALVRAAIERNANEPGTKR